MCHSKRTEMCQPYLYKVVLRFLFPLIAFIKEIVDPSLENFYLPQYKLKSNPAEDLSDTDASWDSIQNSKMMIRLLKRLFINAFFIFLLSLSLSSYFSPPSLSVSSSYLIVSYCNAISFPFDCISPSDKASQRKIGHWFHDAPRDVFTIIIHRY